MKRETTPCPRKQQKNGASQKHGNDIVTKQKIMKPVKTPKGLKQIGT